MVNVTVTTELGLEKERKGEKPFSLFLTTVQCRTVIIMEDIISHADDLPPSYREAVLHYSSTQDRITWKFPQTSRQSLPESEVNTGTSKLEWVWYGILILLSFLLTWILFFLLLPVFEQEFKSTIE